MKNVGEDDKVMPSGMSLNELRELQQQQNRGEQPMVDAVNSIKQTGERKHAEVEKIAKGYKVPKVEYLNTFHIIMQNPLHDQETGERKDNGANVQRYSLLAFKQAEKMGGVRAKIATIVHDPIRANQLANELLSSDKELPTAPPENGLEALKKQSEEDLRVSMARAEEAINIAAKKDKEIEELKEKLKKSEAVANFPELKSNPDGSVKEEVVIQGQDIIGSDDGDELDAFLDEKEKEELAKKPKTAKPKTTKK